MREWWLQAGSEWLWPAREKNTQLAVFLDKKIAKSVQNFFSLLEVSISKKAGYIC
jgi:hypothetical protein